MYNNELENAKNKFKKHRLSKKMRKEKKGVQRENKQEDKSKMSN